jgi:hypothetical protein
MPPFIIMGFIIGIMPPFIIMGFIIGIMPPFIIMGFIIGIMPPFIIMGIMPPFIIIGIMPPFIIIGIMPPFIIMGIMPPLAAARLARLLAAPGIIIMGIMPPLAAARLARLPGTPGFIIIGIIGAATLLTIMSDIIIGPICLAVLLSRLVSCVNRRSRAPEFAMIPPCVFHFRNERGRFKRPYQKPTLVGRILAPGYLPASASSLNCRMVAGVLDLSNLSRIMIDIFCCIESFEEAGQIANGFVEFFQSRSKFPPQNCIPGHELCLELLTLSSSGRVATSATNRRPSRIPSSSI